MKRILVLLITLTASLTAAAQTGPWSGKLDVYGNALTLVFHLDDDACTLDSPDQGAKGIPAALERKLIGIKVSVPSINASFEGVLFNGDIVGTFNQNGISLPLTLTPGEPVRNRPQTPAGPFPYRTEEVNFSNGDAVLRGTLTLPEGCTRQTPVLLMVTGSGLQNRDEEIYEHKPFAVIADALARQGFATLRYDDRGFGESTGDLVLVTTEDLKNDALAGVTFLRERFDRVGVLGHSEGGAIALMLAAEGKTDFIVSLAGSVVSGKHLLLQQNRRALTQAGYSEAVTDTYCDVLARLYDDAVAGRTPQLGDPALPPALLQNLQAVWAQCGTPYMRYFLTLDVSDRLGSVRCPVLALNGEIDRQVDCAENLGILQEGLPGSKEIHALPGLNHLFQHGTTGDADEYKDIEETFASEALELILAWLKRL